MLPDDAHAEESSREEAGESWEYRVSNILKNHRKLTQVDLGLRVLAAHEYVRCRRRRELHLWTRGNRHEHRWIAVEHIATMLHASRDLEVNRRSVEESEPVPVDVVQPIELPERVRLIVRSSGGKGLKRPHLADSVGWNIGCDPVKRLPVVMRVYTIDGEESVFVRLVRVDKGKLPGKLVKCRPQIVYCVACDEG